MVSLIEAMKKSWVEKFGVGLDPSMGWPDKWVNKYIEKLEEHMNEEKRRYVDHVQPIYAEAIIEMLKFLRVKET